MRKIKSLVVGLIFALSSFAIINVASTTANAGDCSANSVIKCGVTSIQGAYAAMAKYPTLFGKYGVDRNLKNTSGYVHKNGNVTDMSGNVIATNAHSVGRQNIGNSSRFTADGVTWYERPTSTSFASQKLEAYIFFKADGTFSGAMIKDCGNPVRATNKIVIKKITVCDLTTRKMVTINEKDYNTSKHSKNAADCEPIKVCDLSTKKIVTIYKSQLNNSKHTTDLSKCAPIVVKHVDVCELATGSIVKVTEEQAKDTSKYSSNLDDCKPITVCDLSTNKIITIRKNEMKDTYTTDTSKCGNLEVCVLETRKIQSVTKNEYEQNKSKYSTNMADCEDVKVCVLETGNITTITKAEYNANKSKYSTNMDDCAEMKVCIPETKEIKTIKKSEFNKDTMTTDMSKCDTPVVESPKAAPVPEELPTTGLGDLFTGSLGLGMLAAATYYYSGSKKAIANKLQ